MTTHIIETVGLRKQYQDHTALEALDLQVQAGEIYGFLGPNGAGKSTTVRILTTLLRPTAGTALVCGYDVTKDPVEVRTRIGATFQATATDPKLTGRELLELQGELRGLTRREVRAALGELRDVLALGPALNRRMGALSGGMRRRVDIGCALLGHPQLVFLDEPSTGLDPDGRMRIWEKVAELASTDGTTVFLTTQYLEEADVLADRVGIIAGGVIVAEGSPEHLKRQVGDDLILLTLAPDAAARAAGLLADLPGIEGVTSTGDEVSIRTRFGAASLPAVMSRLAEQAIEPADIRLRRPTLDDVYMTLTGTRIARKEQVNDSRHRHAA